MKIHDCIQGSELWFNLHRGIPTASCFDQIITAKTMKLAAAHETLICELIGQLANPGSIMPQGYMSPAMVAGVQMEPEARSFLEMEKNLDVQQVGFITTDDGKSGCSPDGLIGDDSGLELKCPMFHTHVKYLLSGELPSDYKAQVHGSMIVTGRTSWWFMSYCPPLEPLLIEVKRDEFTEALEKCLEEFYKKFEAARAKIRLPSRS